MDEHEIIMASMYEAKISTKEMPVIGTQALSTCVGVLLYSPAHKRAIVAHSSTDWESIIRQTVDLVISHGLDDSSIYYLIIPGYYEDHYNVKINLEKAYRSLAPLFIPFEENSILEDLIETNDEWTARCFAFDASTGEFVTNKVTFGPKSVIKYENTVGSR